MTDAPTAESTPAVEIEVDTFDLDKAIERLTKFKAIITAAEEEAKSDRERLVEELTRREQEFLDTHSVEQYKTKREYEAALSEARGGSTVFGRVGLSSAGKLGYEVTSAELRQEWLLERNAELAEEGPTVIPESKLEEAVAYLAEHRPDLVEKSIALDDAAAIRFERTLEFSIVDENLEKAEEYAEGLQVVAIKLGQDDDDKVEVETVPYLRVPKPKVASVTVTNNKVSKMLLNTTNHWLRTTVFSTVLTNLDKVADQVAGKKSA